MQRPHWRILLLGGVLAACSDGPKQTFTPLAAGRTAPNLSPDPPFTDGKPTQPLGASTAGSNALVICTPEKRRKTWESALQQPVVPIKGMGGIDATANLTFLGVSIDQVEQALCQGDDAGAGDTVFGEQGELDFSWSTSTRLVTQVSAFSGYRGVLAFTHPTTKEKFTVSLESRPIDINGQPLRWNWRDDQSRAANATRFYNAIMMALAPDKLPKDAAGKPLPDPDCTASGGCIATILGNVSGALAIAPLGFLQIYFDLGVDDSVGKDIVTRIYIPIQKDFAYTRLPFIAKLPGPADPEGPVSSGPLGKKTCVVKPGVLWHDFLDGCIHISGDATADAAEEKKFLSGITHGTESYRIDVVGIDPQFLSTRVHAAVDPASVQDGDRPEANDPLQRLTLDQQTNGRILNDYAGESPTGPRDNHGSGLVNLTYAILVQKALDAADTTGRLKHPIGDPACKLMPGGLAATPAAAGCTGMEGFVTTAPATLVPPGPLQNVARGAAAIAATTSTGLKPANNQIASFLDDPTAFPDSFTTDVQVVTWAGSARRVIEVLGHNDRLKIPSSFREPRAYATLWMQALTQYLVARGNVGPGVTLADVLAAAPDGTAAHKVDPNYFFFDTDAFGQQFDTAEYIQRDYATIDRPFYDLQIVVDATGGILNQFTFDAYPLKGERALLQAVGDPKKPIGSDGTLLLTNLFGSATLSAGWSDPAPDPTSPYKTAFDCAAADLDPANAAQMATFMQFCGPDNLPPVDAAGAFVKNAAGRPVLEPYKGGFASTATVLNIGRNVGTLPSDLFKPMSRNLSLEQAKVQIGTRAETFNPAAPAGPPIIGSIGYFPPNDSNGFFIPINASRDRFVKTEDFFTSGVALTTTLKTIPVLQDLAVVPGAARLASVDTNDFLGEVFVCKDGGELLTVRMFTPSEVVMEWLLRHPNAYPNCNMVIDYFEYGTVVSRVTSITNGVIVNFTRPAGITAAANNSAVADVDLFAPGQ